MGRFYLVRHGEPELKNVFLGRTDSPLSTSGRAAAATSLSALQGEAVYCSPLSRSLETATYIRSASGVVVLEELSEIDFGEWETKNWEEVKRWWPGLARMKQEDWLGVTPPGGECWTSFRKRVLKAWVRIEAGPSPAIVVAHMAVNAVLAGHLVGVNSASFRQNYCEVLVVDSGDKGRSGFKRSHYTSNP